MRNSLPVVFFALALLGLPATSLAQCGGDGQRACCNGAAEFSNNGGNCNTGAVPVPGCTGACACSTYGDSVDTCYVPVGCGGEGQRACCNGRAEFSNNGLACNSGLVQVDGCDGTVAGNCACGHGGGYSQGTCVKPATCGGKGQRACCSGLLEFSDVGLACNANLIPVPGCAGDCTCGGTTSVGEATPFSCTTIESIAEPATNSTPSANESATPWTLPFASLDAGPVCPRNGLCGYADLHVHMFASMAHGGATLAGEAWNANGVNKALGEDYGSSLSLVDKKGNSKPSVSGSCPDFLRNATGGNLCTGQVLFHGDHTAIDSTTGGGTNDGSSSNLGVPLFNGWPQWTSTTHQQVYYKWLERAWLGGLRLMVMDAVTNEALCKSSTQVSGTECTLSMTAIDAQLTAAHDFQIWLDTQYGGTGKGWFQIVTSPQDATSVIQQGKLAVVLGIEVDNLFNCHAQYGGLPNTEGPACDSTYVLQQLQKYYGMGVRHIFPIHNFDNAYGTPATWQDPINVGNYAAEGGYWDAVNCTDPGYAFYLDSFYDNFLLFLGFGIDKSPGYASFSSGSCHNTPGLTGLGQYLIQQAMKMGMIIDIDHMSIHAFNDTIALARQTNYAGIAVTHVQSFDLYSQTFTGRYGRHERMRTKSQLQSIADLGGIAAIMLKDDVQDTGNGWCLPNGTCPFGAGNAKGGKYTVAYNGPGGNYGLNNNCRYSTTEWAQAYIYGADTMGGPVAMGSDFNGVAGHVGPRFGSGACGGDGTERSAQEKAGKRLLYPFSIPGFGTFDKQVSGQRIFDFNTSGLAHIGLLPDMIADLKNVGLTDTQLRPLFGSAQAYIDMWTKSAPTPPAITSAAAATFTVGTAGSFTVTASGSPLSTFSETGALPSGVTLNSTTGVLGGTPAAGTGGAYSLTITANNGVSPNATQNFTLTVDQAPAITSGTSATFTTGATGSFTVTASGFPVSTFSETGALPSGVTLNSSTGALSGTPAAGTGAVYNITITASSGVSPNATQSFALTVNQAPAVTSGNAATFKTGAAGSFSVTATGFPAPAFSETGALPSGVTLNATTGVLAGTPAAGTGAVYNITITASNGVSPNASQSFALTVDQPPAITSGNAATFKTGAAGSFTVTANGFPASTFSETGALPSGVTLNSTTGVLSGTPAAGIGGAYNIAITANNGILPNASQNFTLTVNQPPAITSGNTTSFTVGLAGSFTATATGYPAPTFSETGTLPSGVAINSATGALSGTPAAGTGGVYNITMIAANGVLPNATQSFTLLVKDFTISASPATQTIPAGHDAVYTVAVTSLGQLTGNVALTCSGFPPNSTYTATPSSVALSGTSNVTMHLTSPKNLDLGKFTVVCSGTLATLTHSASASLTVLGGK